MMDISRVQFLFRRASARRPRLSPIVQGGHPNDPISFALRLLGSRSPCDNRG